MIVTRPSGEVNSPPVSGDTTMEIVSPFPTEALIRGWAAVVCIAIVANTSNTPNANRPHLFLRLSKPLIVLTSGYLMLQLTCLPA